MKLNIRMPKALKPYFEEEINKYRFNKNKNDLNTAWYHLERSHILGQAYPWHHSYVHWKMLLFGIHIKNYKEIIGQIPRLLVGGVKSFVGHIPIGNTGGANVPPLKPMKIESDLMAIFKSVDINPKNLSNE